MSGLKLACWTPRRNLGRKSELSLHSIERAIQRFGIQLTTKDLDEMVRQIHVNEAEFLGMSERGTSIFVVKVQGVEVPVFYKKNQKCIGSILPPEAIEEWRAKRAQDTQHLTEYR